MAVAIHRNAGIACTSGRSALLAAQHPVSFQRHKSGLKLHPAYQAHWDRAANQICLAAASEGDQVYKGVYGEWRVEESDRLEVQGYRAGLSVAAAALLLDTVLALLNDSIPGSPEVLKGAQNAIAVAGAAGFGVSLYLIHIYVTPIKRFLQLLWGTGVLGGVALMSTQPEAITQYVGSHPGAVWAIGPFFAAVTGVAFKEGVCYGKPECAALFFMTPALLLGHLSGAVPDAAEHALLMAFTATAMLFAGRKYTQAIKDDIGDKSVFMFQALPEQEQERIVTEMQRQQWEEK